MIYFDIDKNAYGYEISNYIATVDDAIWQQYAGTDKWDIIDGVFTDITDTPEYIEKQLGKAKEQKTKEINQKISELEVMSSYELLFNNKENIKVYQDVIKGLEDML